MDKMNSLIKSMIAISLSITIVFLASCYPEDNLSISETDIVMTSYYDSVKFTDFKTYYMSDTVYVVRKDSTDKSLIAANDLIIKTIADNMASIGYERLPATSQDTPDVRISSAAITIKNVSVGWWYPYYPGWRWGWGWKKSSGRDTDYYYPGYPGYYPPPWWGMPYYSSYTTGTILIEMANPDDYRVMNNDTVTPIYWAAGINGVLSSGSNDSRIKSGINKAFELSPEIKTN